MLWYLMCMYMGLAGGSKLGECRQSQGGYTRLDGSQYIRIRI